MENMIYHPNNMNNKLYTIQDVLRDLSVDNDGVKIIAANYIDNLETSHDHYRAECFDKIQIIERMKRDSIRDSFAIRVLFACVVLSIAGLLSII